MLISLVLVNLVVSCTKPKLLNIEVSSHQFAEGLTAECKELFKTYVPDKCADIPYVIPTTETTEVCDKRCEKNENECCKYECLIQTTGSFVDGKFQTENWFKQHDNYFVISNSTAVSKETWMPIIKKSFETCEKLSKNLKNDLSFLITFRSLNSYDIERSCSMLCACRISVNRILLISNELPELPFRIFYHHKRMRSHKKVRSN